MVEENLIFIISQPRSGSTLLQNLLSNNKEVNTTSESWVLLNFIHYFRPDLMQASFDSEYAIEAFDEYLDRFPHLNINKETKEFILHLYEPMLKGGFKYAIDKTPRYFEILNEVISLFPESKVVILKRNPIDVVNSIIRTWDIYSFENLMRYHRDILKAPFFINDFCKKNINNSNIYVVKYEDIIFRMKEEIEAIYNWIGIAYNDEVLEIKNNDKLRGKYGDPYVKSDLDYDTIKLEKSKRILKKKFHKFLLGYADYLGEEFLFDYGEYTAKNSKSTMEFNYFQRLGELNNYNKKYGLKRELMLKFNKWFLS